MTLPKKELLQSIYDVAHEVTLNHGDILTEQFAKVDYFYLLLEGDINFYLKVEEGVEELMVGNSAGPMTPIGWSGLISPNRYATTAMVASESAKLLCWEFAELESLLKDDQLSVEFVSVICQQCSLLIKESINLVSENTPNIVNENTLLLYEEYQSTKRPEEEDVVQFLRQSPFFEIFEEDQLEELTQYIERRQYRVNDVIYDQDVDVDGMYLMVSGKVTFSYQDEGGRVMGFRNLVTPGFVVGWAAAINSPTIISATAKQESVIYFLPKSKIDDLAGKDLGFAREFHYRLLWLIGHQLQAIRARLISAKFNHEIIAISNLIEQNSANLKLTSQLHKVPHLLQNKLTIENGVDILKSLKSDGDAAERNISALCLDTMVEVNKELKFYKGLVQVYQSVVDAPQDLDHSGVRKRCAEYIKKAFMHTRVVVQGYEYLPDEPGHIFIYNHLRNHPFNTLPNNFQITLDSHYISSEILYKKYGDPGIRIVRVGRGGEYAHQDYYQRLGHIDVYTNESDPKTNTKEYRELKRKEFYKIATGYLDHKTNLLISPEGTSFGTDESPGAFKSGAFRLAMSAKPEPYIVPIAVANFDKRVRKNTFSVVINRPFKMSDYISDPTNKDEMKMFLDKYRERFTGYVEEAIRQASI